MTPRRQGRNQGGADDFVFIPFVSPNFAIDLCAFASLRFLLPGLLFNRARSLTTDHADYRR
jgi:hypothetical protein